MIALSVIDDSQQLVFFHANILSILPSLLSQPSGHRSCNVTSCGVNAQCEDSSGGCVCSSGYEIPTGTLPTGDSYGCAGMKGCPSESGIHKGVWFRK